MAYMANDKLTRGEATKELGVSSTTIRTGIQQDEFLPQLTGQRAIRKYREMIDNDAVIGAILLAMEDMLRAVDWRVEPVDDSPEAEAEREFVETLFDDMSHTFEDFIESVLTYLPYGFSFFEVVYKTRNGPMQRDPTKRSKYTDGRIGVRKLAARPQNTLERFEYDDDGGVNAFIQDGAGGANIRIPIEKGLLFKTVSNGNSPYGRALDPNTPIPTPDGWRIMDDILPGDRVFDECGRVRYVTARKDWDDRPCYRVEFGNGDSIIADANHQWLTQNINQRNSKKNVAVTHSVRTTEDMTARVKASNGCANYSIPLTKPIEYIQSWQPIDPYILGLWLGDGNSRGPGITSHVDDVEHTVGELERAGYTATVSQNGKSGGNGRLVRFRNAEKWDSDGPAQRLRTLGVLCNKHIPDAYLRASVEQRLAILAGLMDSDGYVGPQGQCEFSNTNKNLADGVFELVSSLGIVPKIRPYRNDHDTPAWKVTFTPDFAPFRLPRKVARCKLARGRKNHYIRDIVRVENRRTVCIEVDSPSHLFLAGKSLIPTHNSVLRNAYKSYYYLTNIQNIEAIAIERELNGLPVGRIPSEYLASDATAAQVATRNKLEQILRDVKMNEQGYIMLPSDPYLDLEGKPTNNRLVDIELMASQGSRNIQTGPVIGRYQADIARSVLADFLMLGQGERGSFALSKSKADLFLRSLEGYARNIAAVLNRHLLPKVWELNGLNIDLMPTIVPGDVAPVDLGELGAYIRDTASVGALGVDGELEAALREFAGLPEAQEDPDMLGRAPEGE